MEDIEEKKNHLIEEAKNKYSCNLCSFTTDHRTGLKIHRQKKLDKHLQTIPDEPKIGGLVPTTSSQINMLPSNIKHLTCQTSNRGQGG